MVSDKAGGLRVPRYVLLVQNQSHYDTVLLLLFSLYFEWLLPAIEPCVQAEIYSCIELPQPAIDKEPVALG